MCPDNFPFESIILDSPEDKKINLSNVNQEYYSYNKAPDGSDNPNSLDFSKGMVALNPNIPKPPQTHVLSRDNIRSNMHAVANFMSSTLQSTVTQISSSLETLSTAAAQFQEAAMAAAAKLEEDSNADQSMF